MNLLFYLFIRLVCVNFAENAFAFSVICRICFATYTNKSVNGSHLQKSCQNVAKRGSIMKLPMFLKEETISFSAT